MERPRTEKADQHAGQDGCHGEGRSDPERDLLLQQERTWLPHAKRELCNGLARRFQPARCNEEHQEANISRSQCDGEFPREKRLLVHKSPVDRPLIQEYPRKLESSREVAERVHRYERPGNGDLDLCHEEYRIQCPSQWQSLQQEDSNGRSCEKKTHFRANAERVCHASDGPYAMLVRVNSYEEEAHGEAIIE